MVDNLLAQSISTHYSSLSGRRNILIWIQQFYSARNKKNYKIFFSQKQLPSNVAWILLNSPFFITLLPSTLFSKKQSGSNMVIVEIYLLITLLPTVYSTQCTSVQLLWIFCRESILHTWAWDVITLLITGSETFENCLQPYCAILECYSTYTLE